jgi:hypothetical protein
MHTQTGELPTFGAPADAEQRETRLAVTIAGALLLMGALSWVSWGRPAEMMNVAANDAVPSAAGIVASLGLRPSHNARYQAEVMSATPFALREPQRWAIRLTQHGGAPVATARIAVKSWAPQTGEVSRITPSAHYIGRGRYVVDDIVFNRPGLWNVALVIDGIAGVDSLAFNVIMPTSSLYPRRVSPVGDFVPEPR